MNLKRKIIKNTKNKKRKIKRRFSKRMYKKKEVLLKVKNKKREVKDKNVQVSWG